MSIEYNLVEPS